MKRLKSSLLTLKKYLPFLLAMSLFGLYGCGSGYLTKSKNYSNVKREYKNIVVIGKSNSEISRRSFEDRLVAQLYERGVDATASYNIPYFDAKPLQSAEDINGLKERLVGDGYDGVVVTHMVDSQQFVTQTPSSAIYYPGPRYRRFGAYYSYYPSYNWNSTYVETGIKYFFESALYSLDNSDADNLQWVGQFRIVDPVDIDKTIEKYSIELAGLLVNNSVMGIE
ncbi:hypothetical protein [Flagellimonas zhangzhouensis]|uniref:DUF4136 domain-containing protein n=1 Tax=Flagellimonas zhangzhouensis TaxID=1073328 RepID=A0A1H2YAQ9_9FLAO|nr:hypothetical protein [Allomuricauda zhangzhouensis]SDQ97816.1 hypothetical protein SAMN05216294_3031 [Allomuricauda zhangzhouensis]SDX02055.1 hypothetical protein SAMN04487892_2990 [Allomuricauda zhangzhouensis]